jgi:hypothetical protein
MRRMKILLLMSAVAAVLSAYGAGLAGAEPGKNKITVEDATCSDGVTRTLEVNAMGKSVKVEGSGSSLIVKDYTLDYSDPETGDFVATVEYGGGKKKGLQDRLVTCEGQTTTEIFGFGLVTIDYEFQGFFTPERGNQGE